MKGVTYPTTAQLSTGGSGTDANAVHVATAGEIAALTTKTTPVSGDFLLIEDSAASNAKKKITVGSLPGGSGTDANAVHVNASGEISAVTLKATPVSADVLLIEDSAASNAKKRITVGSLPAGVTSFNTRTGAVTPASADYTSTQITGTAARTNYSPGSANVESNLAAIDTKFGTLVIGVSSVYTRTGAVVAASGDYSATLITGTGTRTNFSPASANVEANLVAIDTKFGSLAPGGVTSFNTRTGAVTPASADYTSTLITGTGTRTNFSPVSANVESNLAAIDTKFGTLAPGGVTSVYTRTGAVVAVSGDYSSTLITGTALRTNYSPVSANVESNLVAIDTKFGTLVTGVSSVYTRTGAVVAASGDYSATQITGTGTRTNFSPGVANVESNLAAVDTKLGTLAPVASPTFTGTPAAPTPTAGDSSTKLATTAFVGSAVSTATAGDVHTTVSGEIAGVTLKATPVSGDFLLIEDSAATNAKKRITIGSLPVVSTTDPNAVHTTTSGEIAGLTVKGTPVSADLLLIEDSAASNAKKKVTIGTLPVTDTNAVHTSTSGEIAGVTLKATPVSADLLLIEDSAASNAKKRITISSLPVVSTTDPNAVHTTTSGEIAGLTVKGTPVAADLLLIEDSAATNAKKKVTIGTLPVTDTNAVHVATGGEISAVTLKATPVSADVLLIEDSAASNAKKRITVGSLPSVVASVFTRTGAVVAASGDYSSTQITGTAARTNYSPGSANVESNLVAVDTRLGGLLVEELDGLIEAPTAKTYPLIGKAKYACTINSFYVKCASGSLTYKVQIGGVDVTGLGTTGSPLTANTTAAEPTASAANSVAAAARVTLVVISVTSPTDFEFVLQTTRT